MQDLVRDVPLVQLPRDGVITLVGCDDLLEGGGFGPEGDVVGEGRGDVHAGYVEEEAFGEGGVGEGIAFGIGDVLSAAGGAVRCGGIGRGIVDLHEGVPVKPIHQWERVDDQGANAAHHSW